jgi:DNA-binding beta-propeller fold protein YncE
MRLFGFLRGPSVAVAAMLAAIAIGQPSPGHAAGLAMPQFQYDPQWLKLPEKMFMGEVVAAVVDRNDHLWVLHRPRTVKDHDASEIAPPVLEFDCEGRFLRGFGGPGQGYEWPEVEHSLALTAKGDVWVGGNFRGNLTKPDGHGDDMLLEFDSAGRFVRQIGRKGAGTGNSDTMNFKAPADIFVDRAGEVYIADGYVNRRVIVFSARDGHFLRMWGAFGTQPPTGNPAQAADLQSEKGPPNFSGVHGVEKSRDGLIYVSDRANQRIQVFTPAGKYLRQGFVNRNLSAPLTASGITFSKDRGQKYLFVADWGNGMIVVLDRKTMKTIGTIGHTGTAPGEFKGPHLIDTDSRGVIYVAEVQGRRLQRLVPR